jgi:hypothetical protein
MIQIKTMGEKHAQLTPQQKLQASLGSVDLVESTLDWLSRYPAKSSASLEG